MAVSLEGGGNALQVVLAAFALRTSQANKTAEQLRKKKKKGKTVQYEEGAFFSCLSAVRAK